jgi:glycosyltransferase involved in cell wall biosynthesis
MSEPRILHVLPHPGGGGERYVDHTERIRGFRFARLHLTADGGPTQTAIGLVRAARAVRGCDLIHIHGDSAALVCRPLIGRRSTVISLHGMHLIRRLQGAPGSVARAGLRSAMRRSDAVIAESESEAAEARAIAGAIERVALIHNGVPQPERAREEDRAGAREGLRLKPADVAVLMVGELSERKQVLQYADAIKRARERAPGIVGVLAGEGPLRSQLRAAEGVRLLGRRPDIDRLLAAADVFVMPSEREGLSLAVLEAMVAGKAMVVSDGAGNPDAVGDSGLVFPVGDTDALAAELVKLAEDPDLRRSLGEAAAARASERFSLSGMLESTRKLYERVLRGAE